MALFHEVARVAEALSTEGSRLKKRAAIAEALGRLAGDRTVQGIADAGRFCLYLAGQPYPEADSRKLNAGGALLSRAVKEVSGAADAALTAAYRRHGDLGAAAHDLLVAPYGKAPAISTLTLDDISRAFDEMAAARSTAARFAAVESLLRRATALDAKYLLKLMLGDMRIGVKQSLVEEAIAESAGADVAAVRHAVMLEADLAKSVQRAFEGTLGDARMTLFHPLGFMLASPVETPEEAVERFTEKPKKAAVSKPKKSRSKKANAKDVLPVDAAEEGLAEDIEAEAAGDGPTPSESGAPAGVHALLEDKYDGMRAQVHCGDPAQSGRVAIYSRNREDITESFPELQEAFRDVTEPLILDGEILGWDIAADKALPFAVMGQRIGRKRVDNEMRKAIPVLFMTFDLLFEGGELLLPKPLSERRIRLEAVVERLRPLTVAPVELLPGDGPHAPQTGLFAAFAKADGSTSPPVQRLRISPVSHAESAEAIDRAYRDARGRANEGVMLKAAGSAYLPGRRGLAWLKLKRELATLDVVITGAEFGHGKRAGVLSDYTFAIRGPEDELLNVGKAYSGLTDAEIAEMTEWLKAHTLEDHGHFRTVEPLRILEVAFNNVMRSTRHASGFALRFPRILRIRDDKPLEEIDTLDRVEEIYQSQPDRPEE
ncbi:MAG TPA: ATP-dependent DNA ligase [Acidobacteriaceae bacterium]|jgi:DNA ligase-1